MLNSYCVVCICKFNVFSKCPVVFKRYIRTDILVSSIGVEFDLCGNNGSFNCTCNLFNNECYCCSKAFSCITCYTFACYICVVSSVKCTIVLDIYCMCTYIKLICICNYPVSECKCLRIKAVLYIIFWFGICGLVNCYCVLSNLELKCEFVILVVAGSSCRNLNFVCTNSFRLYFITFTIKILNCCRINNAVLVRSYSRLFNFAIVDNGVILKLEHILCYFSRSNCESTDFDCCCCIIVVCFRCNRCINFICAYIFISYRNKRNIVNSYACKTCDYNVSLIKCYSFTCEYGFLCECNCTFGNVFFVNCDVNCRNDVECTFNFFCSEASFGVYFIICGNRIDNLNVFYCSGCCNSDFVFCVFPTVCKSKVSCCVIHTFNERLCSGIFRRIDTCHRDIRLVNCKSYSICIVAVFSIPSYTVFAVSVCVIVCIDILCVNKCNYLSFTNTKFCYCCFPVASCYKISNCKLAANFFKSLVVCDNNRSYRSCACNLIKNYSNFSFNVDLFFYFGVTFNF